MIAWTQFSTARLPRSESTLRNRTAPLPSVFACWTASAYRPASVSNGPHTDTCPLSFAIFANVSSSG